MGYSMSKPETEETQVFVDAYEGGESSGEPKYELDMNDHEFFQLTRLRSEPSEALRKSTSSGQNAPVSTVKMLLGREANYSGKGRFSVADCSHVVCRYLPVNGPWPVDRMDSRVYVSQFSEDGSLFFAGFQGGYIRIYNVENGWKLEKEIIARGMGWTITDTQLSPDQHYLVYSSMSPILRIVNLGSAPTESHANINDIHEGLDLSLHDDGAYNFGIFSVKFSTDGHELVAGSSDDSIYVYDLEQDKLTLRIPAHESDVNTVTFADETGHLIYSGSDDNFCKVWDRRCMNTKGKPAGVLTGHLEGVTFIDSRGDGRYFISNGKDQTTKLWDIRKMSAKAYSSRPTIPGWDYRWMDYPPIAHHFKHPFDQSLATYRGHAVLCTLIRCYFSPAHSTGQRFIYTGSHDRSVVIYDVVTGAQVARLQCHHATVRDCCWHPYYPTLVSSSWDGLVARWEFSASGEIPALENPRTRVFEDHLFHSLFL